MGTRGRGRKTEEPRTDALALKSSKDLFKKTSNLSEGPITAVFKFLNGGKMAFMEIARLAPQIEPELACILGDWDGMSEHLKRRTPIERICKAHDIDPMHFFSVVNEAAMKFRDNATLMIASLSMPALVEKSVQIGLTKDGHRDRKMMFEHAGFVPVPQGTRISILNQNSAKAAAQADANVERGLPSFERSISDMENE